MGRLAATAVGLALLGPAAPALAMDGAAFVAAFAEVCIPERLSFAGTKSLALATGWTIVAPSANPELAAMMGFSEAYANDPEFPMEFDYEAYRKLVGGNETYLIVSRAAGESEYASIRDIGCYLYDFAATEAIDPAAVSAMLMAPVVQQQIDDTITGYLWGPPPGLPGTSDVYLTLIPEGSPHAEAGGFTGLVLKFTTAEPRDAADQAQ